MKCLKNILQTIWNCGQIEDNLRQLKTNPRQLNGCLQTHAISATDVWISAAIGTDIDVHSPVGLTVRPFDAWDSAQESDPLLGKRFIQTEEMSQMLFNAKCGHHSREEEVSDQSVSQLWAQEVHQNEDTVENTLREVFANKQSLSLHWMRFFCHLYHYLIVIFITHSINCSQFSFNSVFCLSFKCLKLGSFCGNTFQLMAIRLEMVCSLRYIC